MIAHIGISKADIKVVGHLSDRVGSVLRFEAVTICCILQGLFLYSEHFKSHIPARISRIAKRRNGKEAPSHKDNPRGRSRGFP